VAKRRCVDIKDMTDDEVRSLIKDAARRERWMPGGYSDSRKQWTAMRQRGEAELARRARFANLS